MCLGQVIHFDVYRLGVEQTLSLEPPMAEFLKTKEGINMWNNRIETFSTLKSWTKRIARWHYDHLFSLAYACCQQRKRDFPSRFCIERHSEDIRRRTYGV